MGKYLLTYHGGNPPQSEEEGARVMAAWTAWFGGLGVAVADAGNPTAAAKSIASDGAVSDGQGADNVTGYSILSADSLDDAVAVAKGCPHLQAGGRVTVHQTLEVM